MSAEPEGFDTEISFRRLSGLLDALFRPLAIRYLTSSEVGSTSCSLPARAFFDIDCIFAINFMLPMSFLATLLQKYSSCAGFDPCANSPGTAFAWSLTHSRLASKASVMSLFNILMSVERLCYRRHFSAVSLRGFEASLSLRRQFFSRAYSCRFFIVSRCVGTAMCRRYSCRFRQPP